MSLPLQRHDVTADDGTRLRVYEVSAGDEDEAVLCLHGGITHARALFAPPVDDGTAYSWLHAIADRGRAAYALDVRGYGESDPIPEYDEPAAANDPPVRAWDAAHDVKAAADFVRDQAAVVHLLGVSWGTLTGGSYLEQYDDRPASFAMVAPVYKSPLDFGVAAEAMGWGEDLDAYIVEEYEVVKERQGGGPVFEAVWAAMMDSNQGLDDRNAYIAQTGAIEDTRECCNDNPQYDAASIDVPTLVARGAQDYNSQRDDAMTLFDELSVSDDRADYTEFDGAGHFIMHGERRADLWSTVADFQDRV